MDCTNDIDSSNLIFTVPESTSNGRVEIIQNGSILTLSSTQENYYGNGGVFNVIVSDGEYSDNISVNVTIASVNDPPMANDFVKTIRKSEAIGSWYEIDLDAETACIDIDNDVFTYEISTE